MDTVKVCQKEIEMYENGGSVKVLEMTHDDNMRKQGGLSALSTELTFPFFPLEELAEQVKGNEQELDLLEYWKQYQTDVERFLDLVENLVQSANAYIAFSKGLNSEEQLSFTLQTQIRLDAWNLEKRLHAVEDKKLLQAYTMCTKYFPVKKEFR